MVFVVAGLVVLAGGCAAWYWLAVRQHREKSTQVLRWIDSALLGRGRGIGIVWTTTSGFKVPLLLSSGIFRRASMLVELTPRELPLRWLRRHLGKEPELITFQADLDLPPAFSLDVRTFRWFGRTTKETSPEGVSWGVEPVTPFIISTRPDWQKEISSTMTSLARSASREFLEIRFQRTSPHFSVSLPLDSIAPESPTRSCLFDAMRELAGSSSASLS